MESRQVPAANDSACANPDLVDQILCVLIGKNPLVVDYFELVQVKDGLITLLASHHYTIDSLHRRPIDHVDLITTIADVQFAMSVM